MVTGDLNYGLGPDFATYLKIGGEPGILIFRDMTKALAWMALPEEPDANLFPERRGLNHD